MPKHSLNKEILHKSWLQRIDKPSHFTIDGKRIFCQACGNSYDWNIFSQLNSHILSNMHVRNATSYENRPEIQLLITEPREISGNKFFFELCEAFLAADIPWAKLNNPKLKTFLEKYTNKIILDESTLCKSYLKKVYASAIESIRIDVGDSPIYIQIDETTDASGHYMANILVGALRKDHPGKSFLLAVKKLEKLNNPTVTQLILDLFLLLWPGVKQDDINKKFCLLLTDGVPYMLKVGKNLKNTYPKLIHVTCIAHALNLVAEKVRDSFPEVDKLIGAIKAVFRKSPQRVLKYREMFPDLRLPPNPVLTRWGTWLQAVEFYADNFNNVAQVIDAFDPNEAKCINTSKQLLLGPNLGNELAYLSANICFIAKSIKQLEEECLTLSRSLEIFENVFSKLGTIEGVNGELLKNKMKYVMEKTLAYEICKRERHFEWGTQRNPINSDYCVQYEIRTLDYCRCRKKF